MKKIVLLADDDSDDYEIFKESLHEADCATELIRVDNGEGVFEYLSTSRPRPDIIFLDLNMPVMSGWQCLAKLKNTSVYREIPVIMYTTSSHYRDAEIAKDLNAHGLITKPSDYKLLTQVLKRIICTLGSDDLGSAIHEAYLITQ
ncbi:response regulator [Pseudochryseolinea flava]|uniref:Response regulator n=1 Tax=Pseudochryseolinea flava TaxID=2059302 RepID=A0A364XV32_9BACT|nr:response regulator [Pseudochryseolinea flava]RAV98135.1 response regulator [Pseudochryseolinea flava]